MLAHLALVLLLTARLEGETSARWRCEPSTVEVGQPFELVLELEHPATTSGGSLITGELTLDDTWLVLAREPARTASTDSAGHLRTTQAWRVVSLEPGARSLTEPLAALALADSVAKIQVGEARVEVRGLLAAGEDAARPLAEFPEGFGGAGASSAGLGKSVWLAGLAATLLAGTGLVLWIRRRARRAAPATPVTPVERLAELEGWIEGEQSRASCYELTHLLREATDRARAKDRCGLTDEQWLAELRASLEVPSSAVDQLSAVFERAARVKYAGEPATSWALKETFAQARVALQAVGAGGARP